MDLRVGPSGLALLQGLPTVSQEVLAVRRAFRNRGDIRQGQAAQEAALNVLRQKTGRSRLTAGRTLAVLFLVGVIALSVGVANALADAANPILNTMKTTAVDNGDGTVTVFVRGQYNWLSHNSDCNVDRVATGVAVAWGDRNGADNTRGITSATRSGTTVTLTTAAQTFSVGDRIHVSGVSGGTGFNGSF